MVVVLVLATAGPIYAVVMILAVGGLTGIVVLGAERAGMIAFMLAFGTAPMYRGLQNLSGGFATPTDIFLVLGILLLFPGLVARRLWLPPPYVMGVVAVALLGLLASTFAESPIFSIFTLVQWLFFLGVLPLVIAWWRPGVNVVVTLLWSYVAGQGASILYALAKGPTVGNRYQGLSHHINAFGMAGMTALAILLYLFHHHRGAQARVIVLGAAAVCGASVFMSGSRAALAVAVVLVVMVPVVERSAVSGFAFGLVGGLGLVALPLIVQSGHAPSALARLLGDKTAEVADQARSLGLEEGFRRLHESPVLGGGLNEVEVIHNVFLEVAVGIGLIGLVFYLVTLFTLSVPLIGQHPHRRLCYLPVAFIGMGPALPGIFDRTMWVPISLCILASFSDWPGGTPAEETTVAGSTAELSPVAATS